MDYGWDICVANAGDSQLKPNRSTNRLYLKPFRGSQQGVQMALQSQKTPLLQRGVVK